MAVDSVFHGNTDPYFQNLFELRCGQGKLVTRQTRQNHEYRDSQKQLKQQKELEQEQRRERHRLSAEREKKEEERSQRHEQRERREYEELQRANKRSRVAGWVPVAAPTGGLPRTRAAGSARLMQMGALPTRAPQRLACTQQ